jgi:ABC-type bacteriocin/lantibiotic exporter with double-glycine peptidase domain
MFKRENRELYPVLHYGYEKEIDNSRGSDWLIGEEGNIVCLVLIPYKGVVSDYYSEDHLDVSMSPTRRLFRLLGTEKKDITYIFIYALFVGLLSLVLPLGLQTIVELISGGVFFSSVYVLISLVIAGVLTMGIFQIIQISLVEHLQRRIFTKAAFEFAFRIPRIKLESLVRNYAPELINRFFDVVNIQKALPKLLLDLSSGVIQVFFGLLLLSLYHPFFVFFSLFLAVVLVLMFYLTGPKGLYSSINESKHKYKVVQWLEELARTIRSFKIAGNTDLPIRRTDNAVNNYLKYRKTHFNVLVTQFSFFVFFKVAVTGGLLIVGTILVVDRAITLGQFVAAEVIIILVLNAVEKIILYFEVVYDLLTAVDKVSHVTDLPMEKSGGFDLPKEQLGRGYEIKIHNLTYQYRDGTDTVLRGVNLTVKAGEKICIAGPGGSGKSTLVDIIAGLYSDYTGSVSINNFSLRDLDITNLRDKVAKNISPEDIFDGTVLENISIGKKTEKIEDVIYALDCVGLKDEVYALPAGLNSPVLSGGKGLSSSMIHRLILARCLAKKPELIILNDFFSGLSKSDKLDLIRCLIDPNISRTLIAVSNDPLVMGSCDRVIVLDKGQIIADSSYDTLLKNGIITQYFE